MWDGFCKIIKILFRAVTDNILYAFLKIWLPLVTSTPAKGPCPLLLLVATWGLRQQLWNNFSFAVGALHKFGGAMILLELTLTQDIEWWKLIYIANGKTDNRELPWLFFGTGIFGSETVHSPASGEWQSRLLRGLNFMWLKSSHYTCLLSHSLDLTTGSNHY